MKDIQMKEAQRATSAAISACFQKLHAMGKPFPEGCELVPNGTGYFDPTVDVFKDVPEEMHTLYSTVDEYGRKVVVVPIRNFSAVRYTGYEKAADQGKSLVFFERYSNGNIIIEQHTQFNNADLHQTFRLAALMALVGDFLL